MNTPNVNDQAERRQIIELARERNHARLIQLDRWEYLQFTDTFRSIPEGTAVFGDTIIWGYPKIGRIFQLGAGVEAQFEHPFWVEEKIDGYNVRLFRQGDEILVLTRRGYICPFTTDRLDDLIDTRVFAARPDLVLCAEVAGPDNPYNEGSPPFIGEDVQLFVFDIMPKGRPDCLAHREKTQLLEEYGLPGVPQFGKYRITELERLKALMLRLDREGREGIVLKEDSARDWRVKYITGSINISDIRVSEGGIQQLPAEYFMHRILRLVLFMEEHGIEPTPAVYQELGESLIAGTLKAIGQYRAEHKVCHTFRCRFRQRANAELMMHAMERRLGERQVIRRRLERQGEFYLLEFDKILPRTTGLFANMLSGGIVFD